VDIEPDEPVHPAEDEPRRTPTPAEAIADEAADWPQEAWSEPTRRRRTPAPAPAPPPREPRPSSRRGGAILLGGIAALIVAVILIVVLTSGSGTKKPPARSANTGAGSATTQTQSTTVTTQQSTTSTTTSILAQLNLTAPSGAKSPVGVVQVVRVTGGVLGIILVAQGVPANTTHNAYAVWLYNSPTSYKFVGFVQYLVGKNGKIDTEGKLKAGASAYHHLLITLETQAHPSTPGEVVLSGPFREHS
jgi:hypothetical protein